MKDFPYGMSSEEINKSFTKEITRIKELEEVLRKAVQDLRFALNG